MYVISYYFMYKCIFIRTESRYLLILTESLSVVLDEFDSHKQQSEVVFGSKFKDDVSYTQVSCICIWLMFIGEGYLIQI